MWTTQGNQLPKSLRWPLTRELDPATRDQYISELAAEHPRAWNETVDERAVALAHHYGTLRHMAGLVGMQRCPLILGIMRPPGGIYSADDLTNARELAMRELTAEVAGQTVHLAASKTNTRRPGEFDKQLRAETWAEMSHLARGAETYLRCFLGLELEDETAVERVLRVFRRFGALKQITLLVMGEADSCPPWQLRAEEIAELASSRHTAPVKTSSVREARSRAIAKLGSGSAHFSQSRERSEEK